MVYIFRDIESNIIFFIIEYFEEYRRGVYIYGDMIGNIIFFFGYNVKNIIGVFIYFAIWGVVLFFFFFGKIFFYFFILVFSFLKKNK